MGEAPNDWEQVVSAVTPTFRRIRAWHEINQGEWDCVISFGSGASGVHQNLDVLSFGNGSLGPPQGLTDDLRLEGWANSGILEVPVDLPPSVEALVDRTLIAPSSGRDLHRCLARSNSGAPYSPSQVRPFLRTMHGAILAGTFKRHGESSEVWALPAEAPMAPWLREALAAWNDRDPQRYPLRGAWREQDEWRTQRQRAAVRLVEGIDARRQEVLATLEHEKEKAQQELDVAAAEAEAYERRLLLAQGNDLVAVVARALTSIGFDVQDMDAVNPVGGRREDLRIRHPSHPEWVALAEVKGYSRGGGATGDLQQLNRWASLYVVDEGSLPSALWYVVNVMSDTDPDQRPRPLASTSNDVQVFAESGGLVIDTRDLFRAITTDADPRDVSEALVTQTGWLTLPD